VEISQQSFQKTDNAVAIGQLRALEVTEKQHIPINNDNILLCFQF
jgi:hypothetical protein